MRGPSIVWGWAWGLVIGCVFIWDAWTFMMLELLEAYFSSASLEREDSLEGKATV